MEVPKWWSFRPFFGLYNLYSRTGLRRNSYRLNDAYSRLKMKKYQTKEGGRRRWSQGVKIFGFVPQ